MNLKRGRCGKILFHNELDAKIVLARRMWLDKGERRVQPCNICPGRVFHLTKQDQKTELESDDPRGIDESERRAIRSSIASTAGGS